jgi:hypothetical protein
MVAIIGCGGGGGHGSSSASNAEPTIPRGGATQTARGTRTPNFLPTPTQGTPSTTATTTPAGPPLPGTRTATGAATATPIATTIPQGIVRIGPARGTFGENIALEVRLTDVSPGVSITATQNDLYFDPTRVAFAATADKRPDCVPNPAIGKEHTQFGFLPAGCFDFGNCTGIRALVLSFTDLSAIPSGSVLYTCNVSITAVAEPGTISAMSCSKALGSDADGAAVPVGCPDSWIEVEPDEDSQQGILSIAPARGAPGESIALDVSLIDVSPEVEIVATQNDLYFDPTQVTFAATADNEPDCVPNPALGKEDTRFGFLPPGCFDDGSCTGIRTIVLSLGEQQTAIPSGSLLYTCNVSIAASAEVGASDLPCWMALGSDGQGHAIPLGCPDGSIEVALDHPSAS